MSVPQLWERVDDEGILSMYRNQTGGERVYGEARPVITEQKSWNTMYNNVWEVPVTSAWQLSRHSVCSNSTLFMLFTCENAEWVKHSRLCTEYRYVSLCPPEAQRSASGGFLRQHMHKSLNFFGSGYNKLNPPESKCQEKTLIICVVTHIHHWSQETLSPPPGCSKNSTFQ